MSGTLILRTDPDLASEGAALAVQIIDHVRGEGHAVTVRDDPTTLVLPAGVYALQAWLPNGRIVTRTAQVVSGENTELTLAEPAWGLEQERSRPPAATKQPSFGGAEDTELTLVEPSWRLEHERSRPPAEIGQPSFRGAARSAAPDIGDPSGDQPSRVWADAQEAAGSWGEAMRLVWVRLWHRDEPIDLSDAAVVDVHPRGVTLELPLDPGPFALQVGGTDIPWHVVCLPPSRNPRAILRAVAPDIGQHAGGVHVRVLASDPRIEALVGYLETGQLEQARAVGGDVVKAAVELFQSKVANPDGAAVAGYYLLRIDEGKRVHDWPRNFANWFPWLPDAQIIHAWTLLQQPDVPHRGLARSRLLTAVGTGIAPRYTEGVRRLTQGLRMFAAADSHDAAVLQALETAQSWEMACDLSRAFTTYRAADPTQPSPKRVLGLPELARAPFVQLALPLEYEPQRQLRPREREVLEMVSEGLREEEIASRMTISTKTVRNYVGNSMRLLRTSSADAAAELATQVEL
jgi:DNA-binding CsgD family transcriptional regulator